MVGGVATFAYQVSRYLGQDGYPVEIVVPDTAAGRVETDGSHTDGVTLINVPLYNGRINKPWWYLVYPFFFLVYFVRAWIVIRKSSDPEVLAVYWFPDGLVARLVCRLTGRRYHVVVHGLDILRVVNNRHKSRRMRGVLLNADSVICRSGFTSDLVADIGVPRDRIARITDGVETAVFYPSSEGELIRQRFGLVGFQVLFTLGRIVDRKGHAQVLRALPAILKKYPKTKYLVGGDGPEKENLVQLSESLGIQDNVVFAGMVAPEELRAYYNACDVFVMPNHVGRNPWDVEGFGIVFLEAAACGKPVIGGASGGAPDALTDGETGFGVPAKDVRAVEEKLCLLLGDNELRARMGSAGRERVLREFTWPYIADQYALTLGLRSPIAK